MKIGEIEYLEQKPVTSPDSGYPGFNYSQYIIPKGYKLLEKYIPIPDNIFCMQDEPITLRDGTVIYADVYRPVDNTPVPAIMAWGPAGKRGKTRVEMKPPPGVQDTQQNKMRENDPENLVSGFNSWSGPDPAWWVPKGYAIVNVDPRGIFASEGFAWYLGSQDGRDGYDAVEWIASQSWCNGNVGTSGNHWYAISQWFIAAECPPHLKAIAPAEAHGDLYYDEFVRGGIPKTENGAQGRSYGKYMEDICAMAAKYPLLSNEYWQTKRAKFENISIPALVTASYTQAFHSRGVYEAFHRIKSPEKWLRIHCHRAFSDYRMERTLFETKKFFDHYLKNIDNGWEKTPKYRVAVLNNGGKDIEERVEDGFPLKRQRLTRFYLDAYGKLSLKSSDIAEKLSYESDDEAGKLVFEYIFPYTTEITGFSKAVLWMEPEKADDMDVYVRFMKTDTYGNELLDNGGEHYSGPCSWLRASHRELDLEKSTEAAPIQSHLKEEMLTPGECVKLEIGLWPMGMIFERGQRLRLIISGYNLHIAPPNRSQLPTRNKGLNYVWAGGDRSSYILLPIIPSNEEGK